MSLLDRILGKPLATNAEEDQKISVLQGIPILGLDGLSSAAYGPEAALTLLLPLGILGLNYVGPIITIILVLLAILYFSYRQTMAAYPGGGGSYTVAKENLGETAGLLAAAALMIDYILNVAVGISAGIGALTSAVPALHSYTLVLCLATLAFIALINLRGLREAGIAFALPTYLFTFSLLLVIGVGLYKVFVGHGAPVPITAPPPLPKALETVSLWLLLQSFASGCAAMTGVEAVSNAVSAFKKPAVLNAQRTLAAIVAILAALLAGIAFLSHAYHIGAMDQSKSGYQSIISQLVAAVAGRGVIYYVTIGSVLTVLALSANTSFAGFPRLARLLAHDDYLPHAFANRGRRLVYTLGVAILTAFSALLLIVFGGITDALIPLFAIGAFLAFTLSQAGMVMHWRREGGTTSGASLLINAAGAVATAIALSIILVAKFIAGAWITVLLIPLLLWVFLSVKRHYAYVASQTQCPRPLDLSNLNHPIVVVPLEGWNTLTEKALRFGLRLSPDVIGLHIGIDEERSEGIRQLWDQYVLGPSERAGLNPPLLQIVESPFRRLFTPLFTAVCKIRDEHPDRIIAVIIPELVETHWYEYFLHNQRATGLKAGLLLYGDRRVVVINVPWYLGNDGIHTLQADAPTRG